MAYYLILMQTICSPVNANEGWVSGQNTVERNARDLIVCEMKISTELGKVLEKVSRFIHADFICQSSSEYRLKCLNCL